MARKKSERKVKRYSMHHMIEETAKKLSPDGRFTRMKEAELEQFLWEYYETILSHLQEAKDENTIIRVSPFEGYKIEAAYYPSEERIMYGEPIKTKAKINLKAKFTQHFDRVVVNEEE